MNNPQQTIRVGLFFVLGLALAWITYESLNGGHVFKEHGYTIVAPFPNLKGLKTGDEVQMAGVKIGSVAATRLGTQRVEAVLSIDPKVQIPNDAVASVETSSLLGSQHLAVSFGSSNVMLKAGDEIKTKNTPDMNEVIGQLGALGSKLESVADNIGKALGGGGEQGGGGSLFNKLDKLVTDNGPKLTETISNLQDITAKIRNGDGTLGRLVNDPKLHDELLASVTEIRSAAADTRTFISNTQGIVADVKSGKGALGALLYDQPTADNLKITVANVRAVSDKIAKGEGTLGKLLSDDSLYNSAQATLKKADQALDSLGDQGPITAVGVAANTLF
jgi:phospholipid/cholesterol/gamma-HCH transport system substrate-binding protein